MEIQNPINEKEHLIASLKSLGFEPLRLFNETTGQMEESTYLIDLKNQTIANKHGKFLKVTQKKSGYKMALNDYVHRIIWQHANGVIPAGKEIDHIDGKKSNNKLSNLQLLSHSDNCKKAAKDRDFSYRKDPKNSIRHKVQVINLTDDKIDIASSLYQAAELSGVNAGNIKFHCEGKTKAKALPGKDNKEFYFAYTEKEPTFLIKKGQVLKSKEEIETYKTEKAIKDKEDMKVYQREFKRKKSAEKREDRMKIDAKYALDCKIKEYNDWLQSNEEATQHDKYNKLFELIDDIAI